MFFYADVIPGKQVGSRHTSILTVTTAAKEMTILNKAEMNCNRCRARKRSYHTDTLRTVPASQVHLSSTLRVVE